MDMIAATPMLCRMAEHGFRRLNEGMGHTMNILGELSRESDYMREFKQQLEGWINETARITTRCSASSALKRAILVILRNLQQTLLIPE